MAVYLLKFSACLAVFMLFYVLLLEKQTMHRFKRYYLLLALTLALTTPLVTITRYVEPVNVAETIQPQVSENTYITNETQIAKASRSNYPSMILWTVYWAGVVFLGIKFTLNLIGLIQRIRKNEVEKSGSFAYVLLNKLAIPHSFFNYIFLDKQRFKKRQIPNEIMVHEQTHARQKHSIDILCIEFLQIVLWFHPLIYLLKQQIKLNHEFLADQAVINQGIKASAYQQLLITFPSSTIKNELVSTINYSFIKKRLTVMKTHTSTRNNLLRSLLLLPLIAFSIYGFSEKKEVVRTITETTENQDSIPVLHVEQNPLKLTLNGKPTTMETSKSDFNSIAAPKPSKLIIRTDDEVIKMPLINAIAEILKPDVTHITFYSKAGIEIDTNDNLPKKTVTGHKIEQSDNVITAIGHKMQNKPLLKLKTRVIVDCDNCFLSPELLKSMALVTSNFDDVKSFKVRFASKSILKIQGNTFDNKALKQLDLLKSGETITFFDIKTNNETLEKSIDITVKNDQSKLSLKKGIYLNDTKTH